MDLYLLRHAKAFERSLKYRPDSIRPLTPEGEKQIRDAARGIKSLDVEFALILSSPYARAAKTAEIFHAVLKTGKVQFTEAMVPDADPSEIINEIAKKYPRHKSIVVVGHEPHMTKLLSTLLSGTDNLSIDFKKSGFCKLCIEKLRVGKCACLQWLLTPRQLARLAE